MIVSLRGHILQVNFETLWLEVSGVTYEVHMSATALQRGFDLFQKKESCMIYTHVQYREDSQTLYGFWSADERELFLDLMKVNGVGAKLALNILGAGSVEDIKNWVITGNKKALIQIPRLGRKVTEQIFLTLQSKWQTRYQIQSVRATAAMAPPRYEGVLGQIRSTLMNLGFKGEDIDVALKNLPQDLDFEEGLRLALQRLNRFRRPQSQQGI